MQHRLLLYAAAKADIENIKKAIKLGADVNAQTPKEGWTSLYILSGAGHTNLCKLLIENGADLNICSNNGRSPLATAERNGHAETADYLRSLAGMAIGQDTQAEIGFNSDSSNQQNRILDRLRKNLSTGKDVNEQGHMGFTALMEAAEGDHYAVAEFLIANGANLHLKNAAGHTALMVAKIHASKQVADLLQRNAGSNSIDEFIDAAEVNNIAALKKSIESGIDLNAIGSWGTTALVAAVNRGSIETVEFLISNGANPNIVDKPSCGGFSALMRAAQGGSIEKMKILLSAGADVHARNAYKNCVLGVAVSTGDGKVVKMLLEAGADPNSISEHGRRVLRDAAWTGNLAVLKVLIECGADVNAAGAGHLDTALNAAKDRGHTAIIQALLTAGAK